MTLRVRLLGKVSAIKGTKEMLSMLNPRRRPLGVEFLKRFGEDTHGGALIYIAVALPVLLGVSGLAVDASIWYSQKRSVQAIADTTAYSMALEMERMGDETLATTAAKNDAISMNGIPIAHPAGIIARCLVGVASRF